jgi:small subunit ribosomal protein S16
MVVIRLSRGGKKKNPFYHMVVADSRMPRDGRRIEKIGFYDPMARGEATYLKVDMARFEHWISKGAKPSQTVQRLVKNADKHMKATAKPTSSEVKKEQSIMSQSGATKKAKTEVETDTKAAEETDNA